MRNAICLILVSTVAFAATAEEEEQAKEAAKPLPLVLSDLGAVHFSFARPFPDDSNAGSASDRGDWRAPQWVAGKPDWSTWVTTGVIGAGWAALWNDKDSMQIRDVGDITQIVPPIAGFSMTFAAKDRKGTKQFLWSGLASTGTTHLLKATNNKYRPDATDQNSFPSGHTQASFLGAGFIMQRYGPKWGIPAMTLAAYTGFSRIYSQKHFTDDVISGMSIALFGNWLFVDPADPQRAARDADLSRPRKYRFEWENVDGDVQENLVQAPRGMGTLIDFRFDQVANPQITASIAMDVAIGERHHLDTRYTPFEIRDVGTLLVDTQFGNRLFLTGDDVFSVYFIGDLRVRYGFDLTPESKFTVRPGAGLTYIDTTIDLHPATYVGTKLVVDPNDRERVTARGFLPLLYLRLGYDFSRRIGFYVEADGVETSTDKFYDIAAKLVYRINPKWDVAVGWREFKSDLEIEELDNDFHRSGSLIHIAYSF